jgi:hypothetical protein
VSLGDIPEALLLDEEREAYTKLVKSGYGNSGIEAAVNRED